MSKTSSGVYQLPNGMWGFRYAHSYFFPFYFITIIFTE